MRKEPETWLDGPHIHELWGVLVRGLVATTRGDDTIFCEPLVEKCENMDMLLTQLLYVYHFRIVKH